jgi:transcriptional regulator GlxA family with amidase domain
VPKRVIFVVYPDLQILDLTGPFEVFALANRLASSDGRNCYELEVVSADGLPVRSSSGLEVASHVSIDASVGPIDTLVVVGGAGTVDAVRDERVVAWIRSAARRSQRVTSVCSGAFLLARAGLLDGRRATTHWDSCALLSESFPAVTVDPDSIFVRDGNVWTSAGVTTGMDLALALVEDDLGPDVARDVARWLVLFVQRPGGQAQFSAQLAAQRPQRSSLQDLEGWIADHLAQDLSVMTMAEQVSMSTRTFARVFREELGVTPAAYVEAVRVEAARRLLETTRRPVAEVARACGFGTVETMHRVFKRTVRVTPGEYRRHFGAAAGPAVRAHALTTAQSSVPLPARVRTPGASRPPMSSGIK